MSSVFVLDGRSRAALAIVRSLGKKGIDVTVGEAFRCSCFYSKYAKEKVLYPGPDKSPDLFLQFIYDLIKKKKFDLVLPVRDDSTALISRHAKEISKYTNVPTPNYETFMKGRDKAETIKAARDNNIPHPRTFLPESGQVDVSEIGKSLKLPLLIKPKKSSGSRGILLVHAWDDFSNAYEKVKRDYGLPLIQEFIPHGGSYGVSVLFNKGEPRAMFTHKRLREYPDTGGPSTLCESVKYPEMEEYALKLLKSIKWHGVGMVEFRLDPRDKTPKLMEINPRFWGSLPLAIFSGIDFPYLVYKMALNDDVEPIFRYKIGMQVRWLLLGDLLWYWRTPNKLKHLPAFLKFKADNLCYDVLSLDDPRPAFGAVLEGLQSFMKKERRKHAFDRGWQTAMSTSN